jgi:peptidyl-prolyl cis-trans isomerase C
MLSVAVWAQAPAAKPAASPKPAAAKPAAAKPAAPKPAVTPAKPAAETAASASDPVVFSVGSQSMTRSQFDSFITALPPQIQAQMATPAGKRQMAERLAEVMGLAQEARNRKLDLKPAVKQQLKLQEESVLASALITDIQEKYAASDAELKAYYDAHLNEYEQAKARHILIRFKGSRVPLKTDQKDLTEEESLAKAKEIKARLDKGEDFAALAKAESDDTGSGAQGGDLGSFARGRMVPEFEKAVFEQPIGQVGEPVRSMFGYHVIQVQERGSQPFESLKKEIADKQKQAGTQQAVETLKGQMKTTLNESYFGPAGAAPPPPTGARPAPGTPAAK